MNNEIKRMCRKRWCPNVRRHYGTCFEWLWTTTKTRSWWSAIFRCRHLMITNQQRYRLSQFRTWRHVGTNISRDMLRQSSGQTGKTLLCHLSGQGTTFFPSVGTHLPNHTASHSEPHITYQQPFTTLEFLKRQIAICVASRSQASALSLSVACWRVIWMYSFVHALCTELQNFSFYSLCEARGNNYEQLKKEKALNNLFLSSVQHSLSQYSFISNLSHDRSTASSKTIPPLNAI
jgi:hypothetical protein